MRIFVNEIPHDFGGFATISQVAQIIKPQADIFVLNGFPAQGNQTLNEGDNLVLIRRGEVPPLSELEVQMASRHTPGVHKKLKAGVVGIAGCGGLGSNVALSLARVGVGKLVIADFDLVEPSNLNRQAYFVDQIGAPKVEALKANLTRVNPMVEVVPHLVRLTPENIPGIFGDVQVLVEAFDRADQKAMLAETIQIRFPSLPLVLGLGMAGYGANNLLHSRKVNPIHICGDEMSEAGPHFGLMAPRVGIVANMQANAVLEIILGPDLRIQALFDSSRGVYVKGER